jgi:hypothetical protein
MAERWSRLQRFWYHYGFYVWLGVFCTLLVGGFVSIAYQEKGLNERCAVAGGTRWDGKCLAIKEIKLK